MPPRINTLLTQFTETPHLATELLTALKKHIAFKTQSLQQRLQTFESKWHMTFEEFSERTRNGKLPQKVRTGDVENDFKAWEQTEQLLKHYTSLQTR